MTAFIQLEDQAPVQAALSPDGRFVYVPGNDGMLRVYDTATLELVQEWPVGRSLGNLDVSPDGSFALVIDTGLSFIYRVDTETGEVARYNYPTNGLQGIAFDVVVTSDGNGLFTQNFAGSGWVPLRILDLETGDTTDVGSVRQSSTLSRDPAGAQVFVGEPNSSGGPIAIFTTGEGVTANAGVGAFNQGVQAFSGSLAAIYTGRAIRVLDNELGSVVTITTPGTGAVRDIDFGPNGEFLYVLNQDTNSIIKLDTTTWLEVAEYPIDLNIGSSFGGYQGDGRLIVDPSERFFTVVTDNEIVIIENPDAPAIIGSGDDESLFGAVFDDEIRAAAGSDVIMGGGGNDRLDGGSNVDTAAFSGEAADYTITQTSSGVFEVTGPDGTDTLSTVEFAQFDDQTIRLLPGEGVSVDFETADPSVYADALIGLRDFDGNDLGGDGAWLRIGAVDVNGDGDVDQILVNDAIGRFATVGTAPDGLVYFDDHSWAGETRVAGIYLDPLVISGDVEQGSANDSQRRFQNDLEIENINRVLGADDYDGDGLQDVYLALTDGTAYLRAVMEADGNIRYANYQSEAQVIEFLEANGFGEETYGDWFGNGGQSSAAVEPSSSAEPIALLNSAGMIGASGVGLTRPNEGFMPAEVFA